MIKSRILFILCLIWAFSGCSIIDLIEPEFYKGCCAQPSVQDTIGSTAIFLPNAITPNDDEINDAFAIFADKPVLIKSFDVSEQNGILAVTRSNIRVKEWTDIWTPKNVSGIAINGLYNYTMTLEDEKGLEKTVTGQFCALSCENSDADIIPFEDCHFSTQTDRSGHLIDTLPNLEPCDQ